ncbi:Crp/Fnr family transcriptional regulator [uncultured Rhodospira sp.]|uniref:Crp/Fnr family transcriptional regulator n=1 Tax=uncultured Rhodospira sp. TaxID=1936189 RepID=UPI0026117F09|nr:Crp/Fnr family transcriptional regulator [uncultured Rhodospira sp.]
MRDKAIEDAWRGQAECRKCGIRELALFSDLQETDFGHIHLPIDEIQFEPGSALYHVGDPGVAVFTVRTGLVKLVRYLADGSQRIVRLLRPGDTAGLEAVLGQDYEHTAIPLRSALTCRIPREVVNRLAEGTPRMHAQLMQRWQQNVRQADAWLTSLSTGGAKARVARLLLLLMDDGATRECALFGREDMGAMLGVTTETASRVVAEFRREGILAEKGPNLYDCDVEALRLIAGA